mmetsp:Transcript_946/g.2031  ORF Transcript_946/g.2031 Transcript_946/m.2031 type:complete len:124 (-) Transcript_946:84-455(-)|eukprot:2423503-Rhodomonas_salina.4
MEVPQQIPMAQPVGGGGTGIVHVVYAAKGCRDGNRTGIKILIDGVEVGKLEQGGESSFHCAAGPHQIQIKESGASGFIKGAFGGGEIGQQAVVVVDGQTSRFLMSWEERGCCSSKFDPKFAAI